MRNSTKELWLAFIAVLLITLGYLLVILFTGSIPAARGFFGHSLGIFGFILMLMTETLYSWRKRSRSARWGKMSNWLQFHIFTGLVGPYLILLHTSWKYNGLAGIVLLLTSVVVLSGFIGRYIYTAVPRTADGVAIEAQTLTKEIERVEENLHTWLKINPETSQSIMNEIRNLMGAKTSSFWLIFGRTIYDIQNWIRWQRLKRRLKSVPKSQLDRLATILRRLRTLNRQVASLAMARMLLGLWHIVHIPIGLALFTAAFVHIGAAIYYATLLY